MSIIVERRVVSGADDAEQRGSGSVTLASSDLEMAVDDTKIQTVGIRFTDLDIPQGAIITKAYIQFQADNPSIGDALLTIRGQDADDAAAFTTVKNNISSRPATDPLNNVSWDPPEWKVKGAAGLDQQTPDLSAIVQEIVDRDGWSALNDMAFIITGSGTRRAESFEGKAAAAPLLHIEYEFSEAGTSAEAPTMESASVWLPRSERDGLRPINCG